MESGFTSADNCISPGFSYRIYGEKGKKKMKVREVLHVTTCDVKVIEDSSETEIEFRGTWNSPVLEYEVSHIEPVTSKIGEFGLLVYV